MKNKCLFSIPIIMFMTFFYSCYGQIQKDSLEQSQKDSLEQKMFQDVQKSYLEANIPDQLQFDSLLKRDLEKYFSTKSKQVVVKWEFLREGPTQSGVAYPKYYLWTKIYTDDKMLKEGAVRVAAIEKARFDITDFVSIKEINNHRKDIYMIFPGAVCEKINLLIQNR
ncbi:hypothetical protein [Dyadobacter chenhuakuii]|uniref:Lipoprotein n=1 Tax=Dyadobacter chenhuakuii TaxID=2909339 RepID=A0ABY5EB01_9BACT|nr:hypothetical protein [Dyadobacter chenhuakuii]UTM21763.1 hypothetical protein NFI80_25570 [Dyadobacter chenhuakuii]